MVNFVFAEELLAKDYLRVHFCFYINRNDGIGDVVSTVGSDSRFLIKPLVSFVPWVPPGRGVLPNERITLLKKK